MVVSVQIDINVKQLPQTDFMFEKESFKATETIRDAQSTKRVPAWTESGNKEAEQWLSLFILPLSCKYNVKFQKMF